MKWLVINLRILKLLATMVFTFSTLLVLSQSLIDTTYRSQYEKILLDGKVAYLHSDTEVIVTPEFFNSLKKIAIDRSEIIAVIDSVNYYDGLVISRELWDTLRINPYKKRILEPPYPIFFTHDKYHPPVDNKMVITSRFGRRRRGPHRGIDIDLVTGDKVRAILPGKVRFVGYSRGHGKVVVIRHQNELETVYAHLSDYGVKVNDIVDAGDIIGKGGNTGRSRGSHLHLETRYKGVCIHPEYLFDFSQAHTIRAEEVWITKAMTNPLYHSSYWPSKIEIFPNKDLAEASQKQEKKIYRVRAGDTLHGIARKNGMYVREILSLNGISYNSILKIGQLLVLRK